jgi:hypothetical protein
MKTQTHRLNIVWYLPTAILLLAAATTVWADSGPEGDTNVNQEPRVSTTTQGNGTTSQVELAPLKMHGPRSGSTRSSGQQKPSSSTSASSTTTRAVNEEFWFYDAWVDVYSDFDNDGFFSEIRVTFDVDTIYSEADVYAVIYLSYELGPWNELTDTDDFRIYGASADDEYFIETELVSGYPTGSYDVLIELYDTFDGAFVATMGPEDSSELSYLPLEDAGRDTPYNTTTIIVTEGGGGALSWMGLLALLGVTTLLRTRPRKHQA